MSFSLSGMAARVHGHQGLMLFRNMGEMRLHLVAELHPH